jgi:hypothetical protein
VCKSLMPICILLCVRNYVHACMCCVFMPASVGVSVSVSVIM